MDGNILDGLKILVVDDNEFNRSVARDTLRSKAAVQITEAMNGQEALDLVSAHDFDVILMDVQMPVMDGLEACRQMRKNFPSPKNQIPIIALTASIMRSELNRCTDAGMNDYLAKPFKSSQLLATIAKATGRNFSSIENSTIDQTDGADQKPPNVAIHINAVTNLTYLTKFCDGDTVRMKKYINMFLDSSPGFILKINDAMEAQDYKEVANQVHGYKTRWIMMGMKDAGDLALTLEQQCRQAIPHPDIPENIRRLHEQILFATRELKAD